MTTSVATAQPASESSRWVDLRYRWPARSRVAWYALAVAAVLAGVLQASAYSGASRELVTALAGCLLVASLGQLLVVMVGALDLSVPAYMTLAAAINVHYVEDRGDVFALVLALAACSLISACAGAAITFLQLNALVVTLAVNTIITGALVVWMGQTFSTGGQAPTWLQSLAQQNWGHISALYVVALMLAAVVAVIVYRTRAGRTVGLTGANPVAARMLGIRVHVVYILTFAGAGALYGLAGSLTAGLVQAPDATLGVTYQLTTLTAVAIAGAVFGGGPASVGSLVAAATLLPLIDQTLALADLASGWRVVIQGVLLVLAVAASTLTVLGRGGLHRLTSARQLRRGI